MYNGIASLDHPVVAVKDMEESRNLYVRLGFMVPPRGSHVEWGTGNWCIMFPDDYLELRGILDSERNTLNLNEVLERYGEGVMGVAFGTTSAQRNYEQMLDNGLRPKEVIYLSRNFELPEGWVQPRFALCFPDTNDIVGLMHVVLCQHLTPELIRRPNFLEHENGVNGVISVTGVIDDIDLVEVAQRRLLGDDAIMRMEGGICLTLPSGQNIHLLSKEIYRQRYGHLSKIINADVTCYLGVITLRVDLIDKVKSVLRRNRIPFDMPEHNSVLVEAKYSCGVVLEFIEQK